MLNWAQSEVFNWATAEYSIMIKLKGSPYYHDYVDQGTILDRVVGSSRVRNIENISVPLELTCFFGSKTLRQSFISSEARFWQSRSRKKDHLIEEMEILARRKEKAQEFYYRRSKSIPEAQIYFLCCWHAMTPPHDLELFNGPSSQGNRGCFRLAKKNWIGHQPKHAQQNWWIGHQ